MAKKICLDAGHYGKYNRSPVVPEFYESDFNWKFHLLLKNYLEEYGFEVTTTRDRQDEDMDLYERGRCAKGHDLFLSVHANWAARESADYPAAYVPINGSGDAIGRKLAQCVRGVMGTQEDAMIQSKKSTKGDWDWYGVIYGAAAVGVPGIILEHSFYSNKRSAEWLMDDGNLDKLARAEAAVLAKHFGMERKEPQEVYRVISGAYTVRENADEKLRLVKAKGYVDAFLIKVDPYFKVQIYQSGSLDNAREKMAEVKGKGLDAYISTDADVQILTDSVPAAEKYTQKQFVRDVQAAIGAAVDGIAGSETLGKTPTLSRLINARHAAVLPVQKWLYELGYTEVGIADGIAGAKFAAAVSRFQRENDCIDDGEITAGNKTWRKLLGME